jgi:uncharacterized pyridoxal phosphate-containing UPF0001 family protein
MTVPKFENTWTIGNILTLAAMIVGGIMALAVLRADAASLRSNFDEMKTDLMQQEARVRSLEMGAGRTEEKLINILAGISRVERQLDETP